MMRAACYMKCVDVTVVSRCSGTHALHFNSAILVLPALELNILLYIRKTNTDVLMAAECYKVQTANPADLVAT